MATRFTQISVDNAKPTSTRREVPDAVQPGLYLVVQPSGKKSWAVRYRLNGKPKKLTLQRGLSLADAREGAREAIGKVAKGIDPAAAAVGVPVHTFGEVAAEFVRRHVKENTSVGYQQIVDRFLKKDVLPAWKDRDVRSISRLDVNKLLDSVIDRIKEMHGAGSSANNVHSMLRSLFVWAVGRGYVDSSPLMGIKAPLILTSRDRILSESEIKSVWRACEVAGYPHGPMGQLLLLTGQRRSEVAGMTWGELDLALKVWNIPAERTKNGEPHSVPLSEAVVDILNSVPRIAGKYVLTHAGVVGIREFNRAKRAIDAHAGDIDHWTFHDLRRTVATGMARLHIPLQVTEKILNHTGSLGGIAGIYNRHDYADEKRNALETWGRYVLSLQRPSDNITRMPQRA